MQPNRAFAGLFLSCGILVALGASAGAQTLDQAALQPHRWGYLAVSIDPRWKVVSAAEAAELEKQLREDPENVQVRADLLNYYWHNNLRSERVDSVCWLIEHHPESPILGLDFAWIFPDRMPQNDAADFERARALWQSALNPIVVQPEAFHNAARFFEASDVDQSVAVARRLDIIDPAGHTKPIAHFYGLVLSGSLGQKSRMDRLVTSLPLLEDLTHSPDAALAGSVASELVSYGAQAALQKTDIDLSFVCQAAFELIARAHQLEPQNSEWDDLVEGANRLHCMPAPLPLVTVAPAPGTNRDGAPKPAFITVAQPVQAARLVHPVPPDLPSARQAGLEGVVRFRVRIGTDGHVIEAGVLNGNPALVQPATEALKQYVYSPTLLNGNAIEVETTVEIAFPAK